jgi:hypothetical protein
MTHDYYLTYDLDTRIPVSISGQKPVTVDNNTGVCLVREKYGEDFIFFRKVLDHYYVSVEEDGYASFTYKWAPVPPQYSQYGIPDNIIRDLNYKINVIANYGIEHSYANNTLTITYDLSVKTAEQRNNFYTSITPTNGKYRLYVTRYQDPTALLETIDIDLYQLSKIKTEAFKLTTKETQVTVWATRTL